MTSNFAKAALRGATCLSVFAAMGTTSVFAQDATAATGETEASAEAIVVTGSRIARPEVATNSPISVVDSVQLQAQGITNVQDLVQKLPQAGVPGISRTNSNFLTSGNGVSSINLRNLGDDRTLTLVNGRRFVAGIAGTSIVDVNNIPAEFIDRVEVVTGGASAIYGSDAVAGVVNFVLKDNIEGVTVRAQQGISDRGDNHNYTASITGGTKFGADDRGSIMGNFTYSKDAGLYSRDRKISAQDCLFVCGPSAYSSFPAQGNFLLRGNTPLSNVNILTDANGNPTNRFTFNPDNSVENGFPVGYGYNRNGDRRISTPLERYLGAISAKYEVTNNVTAFFEGTYGKVKSSSQIEASAMGFGAGVGAADLPFGYAIDNPFIPTSIASAIAAANSDANPDNDITSISFARRQNEVFTRSNNNSRETFRIAGGFRGAITDKWNFEVAGVYGRLKDRTATQDVDLTKYAYALDAVRDSSGNIVCRDEAARAAGCAPINLFGYNTASATASQYVQASIPRSNTVTNTQFVATATADGSLITLPYGDVLVAVGAEYRREKSISDWDDLTNAGNNSGNLTPDTIGKFNVKEVFGEIDVPLVKDVRFINSLSIKGAARYSDYSSIGTVFSWNAGGEYSPVRGLQFRGNYAVANRAPNIGEMYQAPAETFPTGNNDPCNGTTATSTGTYADACRSIAGIANAIGRDGSFSYSQIDIQSINGFDGGNRNLREETGKTLTLGAVLSPVQIPGLTLTADYFDIRVTGAIGIVPRQTSIQQCLLTDLSQFCNNVIRDQDTGKILTLNAQNINIATLKTRGMDFNFRYGRELGLLQDDRLDLRVLYTRTLSYKTKSDPSAPVDTGLGNLAYGSAFKHKINGTVSYSTGPFSINWTTTYMSKMLATPEAEFDTPGTIDYLVNFAGLTQEQAERAAGQNKIKSRMYHDVQLKARAGEDGKFEFFVGVDNLFDRKAPVLVDGLYYSSITGTTTAADVYDPYGRRFYAGVQVRF